jgi:hypothetical protein
MVGTLTLCPLYGLVIASEAKQSSSQQESLDCFGAGAARNESEVYGALQWSQQPRPQV